MSNDFITELAGLVDQPDTQNITNNDEVREANILALDPRTRKEGLSKLASLVAAYPTSGNICALYTQALASDGRIADALAFVQEKLPQVQKKSPLAQIAGTICFNSGRLHDATLYYLKAVAAQGKTLDDEYPLLVLVGIYKSVYMNFPLPDLRAAVLIMEQLLSGRFTLGNDFNIHMLRLSGQADKTLVSIMSASARHFGWSKRKDRKWWQIWR